MGRFEIAKPGYNLENDLALRYKVFDSDVRHLQFKPEHIGSMTFASATEQTFDHDLGYISPYYIFRKPNGQSWWHKLYKNSTTHYSRISTSTLTVLAQAGDEAVYMVSVNPFVDPGSGNDFTLEEKTVAVAHDGVDLLDCEEHEVGYYSGWSSGIIIAELDLSVVSTGAGTFTSSVAHGLDYIPAFFSQINDGTYTYPDVFVYTDMSDAILLEVRVDATNVTAYVYKTTSDTPTYNFKIHLLSEPLE